MGSCFFITAMKPVIDSIVLGPRSVDILRLDKMTPSGIGNKYYKLKYNLEAARQSGATTLLSFGGAFSNHIQALAVSGKAAGFRTIGVIRGEDDPQNPTLQLVRRQGMQLHFVERSVYREKTSARFLMQMRRQFGDFYMLPEGGSNELAVQGAAEILEAVPPVYDRIFVACGTGATLAGIIQSAPLHAQVTGVSVLKGTDMLTRQVAEYLPEGRSYAKWHITFGYHLGGYARKHPELSQFIRNVQANTGLETDPVYTAKMVFAVHDLCQKGSIAAHEKVLLIHTGGLQGLDGWHYRFGKG